MSNTKLHRIPLALVVVLAILLASVMTFSIVDGVSMADNSESIATESTLKIGHVSDIHYFPIDHCYQDVTNENYVTSDFYNSMTGDTKLVLESGMVLAQQVKQVIQDAKDGIAPMYMFASGDLSKNGEHTALIDVANALRYMQNEVRKVEGYENFQVFSTVGNHDLYNASGALYSQENGEGRDSDGVSAAQFALIFAGLGYPDANLTGENGAINLTDYFSEDYWHGTFTNGYVVSTTATNLDIHYYSDNLEQVAHNSALSNAEKLNLYYSLGDTLNVLTFSVDILDAQNHTTSWSIVVADASDRETEKVGAFVRVGESEFNYLKNAKPNTKYYLVDGNKTLEEGGSINTENVYNCDSPEIANAFTSGKEVYRATGLNHLCGGRLTEGVVNWIEEFAKAQNASTPTLGEESIICCFHQNALPHWEQEDEILKDFTIYNWEYTSKRLLAMGIRYVFTGHMHASDAMSYTDEAGRTLYDFQTGSIISYDSPRRYVTFTRFNCDGKLGETCESSVYRMDDISETPLNEVPSYNVFEAEAFNFETFKTALDAYNQAKSNNNSSEYIAARWEEVVATNPDYLAYMIQYDNGIGDMSYNNYINKEIYSQLLDRLVSHFVNQDTVDSLLSTVTNLVSDFANSGGTFSINGIVRSLIFPGLSSTAQASGIENLVQYILDTIFGGKNLGLTYKYNDTVYDDVLSLLNDVVWNILDWEYGDDSIASEVNLTNRGKMNVQDIAGFILTAHTAGVEISLKTETKESIYSKFSETQYSDDETYGYKHPTDATYRYRMLAAVKDMQSQLQSGKFVEDLLDALLTPLYTEDGSLLKSILNYHFDFENAVDAGYLSQTQFDSLKKGFSNLGQTLPNLLNSLSGMLEQYGLSISVSSDFSLDANDLCLIRLLNDFLPTIKSVVGDLLSFSLDGPDVYSIIDNFLDSYLVDSFYVGLGGIAEDIVIAFATDVYPDLKDFTDPRVVTLVQPHEDYKYANTQLSYLSTLNAASAVGATFNAATQDNGRVPSRVTGNFDTANSTTAYTVRFYTNEDVYGTFRLLDENGNIIGTVSTTKANALSAYAQKITDFLDVTSEGTFDGIKVSMLTQTKPQYIPLIDLGLLCLTHGEIMDDKDNLYTYADRDNVVAGSVIYWNVTTVTITGLEAGKTYYYDIAGNYAVGDNTASFSLVDFVKRDGYDKDYLTFTTAKDESVDTFEFLTIADIQGMIQGMYTSSHEAVEALLKDERTNTFDFILNAGDMCDNGKNFNQWGIALDTYQDLNLNTSVFFTSGNHENGSGAMDRYFNYTALDENGNAQKISGEYYSFDYANSHFTVLDTNDADKNGLGADQLAWLENDLKNSDAKWKFVLMHKSLYSAGSHATDAEVMTMREQLGAMFAKYGVNMVFAGHDHTYTTTVLVDGDGNAIDRTDPDGIRYTGDGVLYITLGTLGTKYYTYKENDVTTDAFNKDNSKLNTLDSQTFGKVKVSGDSVTFTGYYYNRETKQIEVIGETTINTFNYRLMVILLSTLIPGVAVIGAGTAIGIIVAKKKKAAKLATASASDVTTMDDMPTDTTEDVETTDITTEDVLTDTPDVETTDDTTGDIE